MSETNPSENGTRKSPPRGPTGEANNGTPVVPWQPHDSNELPKHIGRFAIRKLLGEGAFGNVYLGFDPQLQREVAIKVPKAEGLAPEDLETFLRENRLAATIRHPNICPVYEVGTDTALRAPYVVMPVIPETLADVLKRLATPMPRRNAVAITRKLALGMVAAHGQNVIHRDLKPANVLYDRANREVLIADFGLARLTNQASAASIGVSKGTPAYMSPEQARGDAYLVGPLSDVYSLGIILYRMLTGRVPFAGTPNEVMIHHCETPPWPPSTVRSDIDPRLDALCLKALAKHPADRYPSAKAFAAALADYLRTTEHTDSVEALPLANEVSEKVRSGKPARSDVKLLALDAPAPKAVPRASEPRLAPTPPQRRSVEPPPPPVTRAPEKPNPVRPRAANTQPRMSLGVKVVGVILLLVGGAGLGTAIYLGLLRYQKPEPAVATNPPGENANGRQNPSDAPSDPDPQEAERKRLEEKRLKDEEIARQKKIEAKQLEEKRLEAKRLEAKRLEAEQLEAKQLEAKRLKQADEDYRRGEAFYFGTGEKQDYAKAREWYEKAAAQGHASAQFSLGFLYSNGRGVPNDYAKAREWYEKAAAQGHTIAQNNLGVLYDNGRGVPKDYAKAREWYEKAATKGHAPAQYNLGVLYYNGEGVTKDYAKAREWYEKAAAQGHASAQFSLGALYDLGRGVPISYAKAREWYEKAAAQGHASAQHNLGLLYENGEGVTKDSAKAREWYEKAAAQGHEKAKKAIERLNKK